MSPKSKTFNKNDLMKLIKKTRGRDVDIKYFSGYSDLGDLCDKGYFKVQGRSEEWQRFLKSENDNKVLVFFNPRVRTYNICLPATENGHFVQVLNLREQLPLVTRFLLKETHEMITECPICCDSIVCSGDYREVVEGCVSCGALMCKTCVVKVLIEAHKNSTNYSCPFCRREDPVLARRACYTA